MKRALLWLPLLAFAGLLAVIASGLYKPADRTVRSAMIGRPMPTFALPALVAGKPGLSDKDFATGEPHLLNVFASWCAPCIPDTPLLLQLKQAGIRIEGIAVRDTGPDMTDFLARNGDAFDRIGSDVDSRVQLSLGSAGVPESFVIDGQGRIVLQHVGPIETKDMKTIADAVKAAR